ncbi:hypothetical protein [Candidatus Nitrosocosmicus arcticus]|uniref:Uncharacterized protein n=1 Tax=Candidatus Nitrosocosmicus arcticus TaxID=2035267 RepID=A0A557STS1_9ARCH|nr:hypothetical protein [Candidatus Nitrosocosmicus arcticus]TVP40003.1 exported protein of unknown function [Candidatus Nitrosocosmicus arcticus]
MNKLNTPTIKKSLKPLMAISVIATLLIAAIGMTTTTNANAFNFGLKSNDVNDGSIDTDSLFSCVGAAIACLNTNQNNNNEIANNTAVVPPVTEPDCEDGIACLVSTLDATQLGNLKFVLGVPVNSPNAILCDVLDDLTAAELRAAITAPVVGVTDAVATVIINCLIDAGFTNLE